MAAQGLKPATLLKKRLWHRCFPVNFAKFLGTSFLQNPSGGCLRLKACNFIKKETLTQVFSRELCEISKNNFGRLLLVMMVLCNKQLLSNIWSWIHGKVGNVEDWVEKSVAYKKACIPPWDTNWKNNLVIVLDKPCSLWSNGKYIYV